METKAMPVESLLAALGLKPSSMVAGLFGAVLALPYMPDRSRWEKVFAVFGGMACAVYLAPWISTRLGLDESGHNAACFVIGIMGINIVRGLFVLSDRFRQNPEKFFYWKK